MDKFALIGAGGYIASRHVEAIKNIGGDLVAMLDPHDSVGYIDKYFPNASYFKEVERFDRHLDRLKRKNKEIAYVSICSPNYLHDSHIRLALRNNCHAICEKPLVLMSEHLDSLKEIEDESNKKINTILQLRLHPVIKELKNRYSNTKTLHKISLDYITPRGLWYDYSWKGDIDKSGGVATNIGIHFFDMLLWIFGNVVTVESINTSRSSSGLLRLENAIVNYNLSLETKDLPKGITGPYRNITIDGEEVSFSSGFDNLHTLSYIEIINNKGFGLKDVAPVIKLVERIRFQ